MKSGTINKGRSENTLATDKVKSAYWQKESSGITWNLVSFIRLLNRFRKAAIFTETQEKWIKLSYIDKININL